MESLIKFEETKSGDKTLNIDGLYIHSKYNPIREATQIVKNKYKPHHLHIIFGYGCGYVVEELIKECQFNEPILILDPLVDKGIINIKNYDYDRIYYKCVEQKFELYSLISKLTSYDGRLVLIEAGNYKKLFAECYKEILLVVRDAQSREIINVNTTNLFAETWQINHFFNVKNVLQSKTLVSLEKVYDVPVVIASGGPSLTKQIPLLKQKRNQFILICSGSTINTLMKYELEPDYIVSIDGGEANYNHFKDLNLPYAQLFYSIMHHYKINDVFEQSTYAFVPSIKPELRKYLQRRFNKTLVGVMGGGSVAHYALTIAKFITSGPIALIGQDLAYTNNVSHAEGHKSSKILLKESNHSLQVEGYDGGMVTTDKAFKVMLDTFIQLQKIDPHDNILWNCTEGGAYIPGYNQLPFDEFLENYCRGEVTRIELQEEMMSPHKIEDYYKKEIQEYEKILKVLQEGVTLIKGEKGPLFKTSTLNKLTKIDKTLNRMYEDLELNTLLEPTILMAEKKYLPKLNETNYEQFNRVKAYTEDLYKTCYDVIKEYTNKLQQILAEQKEDENVTK